MKRLIAWSILAGILVAAGCDEDDSNVLDSEITYSYSGVAVFDTSEYLFSKRDYIGSLSKIPEPLVNWEQSLGEPFFDVNGDGEYEAAVDSFQDLNGNGYYDSPDSAWSEGIPFDDIDGDGEFDPDPGDHISGYQVGLPYADFNSNYKHDGDLKAIYGIQKWSVSHWTDGSTAYMLDSIGTAVYRFVSDSGLAYDLRFVFRTGLDALVPKIDGLYYYFRSNQLLVPLFPTGKIQEEVRREVTGSNGTYSVVFDRTITFDVDLTVDNKAYGGLLEVMLETSIRQYRFYFANGDGLCAYIYREDKSPVPGTWTDVYAAGEYYLHRLPSNHPLEFPTTR